MGAAVIAHWAFIIILLVCGVVVIERSSAPSQYLIALVFFAAAFAVFKYY